MNESNPTLKKAYKLLKRITKKLGNKNLHFSAQLGVDSEKGDAFVTYAAMIASPTEGVAPITFSSFEKDDFIAKIQDFLDNKVNQKDLEVVYHQNAILVNERSSKWHQEQIDELENPTEETKPEEAPLDSSDAS